jgi:hypothetical protein
MRAAFLAAAALAFASVSGAAAARDIPIGGVTSDDIMAWLQAKGFVARPVTDSKGAVHVSFTLEGSNVGVYFFDCTDNRCGSLQFAAGWAAHGKFDTTQMNRWNRDNRWCRGYFDAENDPWIEMDVDLTPGGSYELLDDEFATFKKSLVNFKSLYSL